MTRIVPCWIGVHTKLPLRNSFGFKVKLGQVTFSLEKVQLGGSLIIC